VRRDDYNYYPSSDPFADLGPPSLQRQSVGQNRTLTNAGIRSDLSYVKGVNNIKAGVTYEQTFLNENDTLGIIDPTYNAPCIESYGGNGWRRRDWLPRTARQHRHLPGKPARHCDCSLECAWLRSLPLFQSGPGSYDLTRGGGLYTINGHTDVKELALYIRDAITKGNWSLNLGIRGDLYNGLSIARQAEPRVGIAYNVKKTSTILRVPMRAPWISLQ